MNGIWKIFSRYCIGVDPQMLSRLAGGVSAEEFPVLHSEGAQQPAGVDGDDHDEQRDGEQQLDGFEHLDHPVRGAAVKVVDIDDDPVDGGERVAGLVLVRVGGRFPARLGEQFGHALEIGADLGHQTQP